MKKIADSAPGETAPLIAGRYRQSRILKRGGDVTTVVATDETTGGQVVLKTVAATAVSAGARMRMAHEAEMLRRLDSDRLASVLDIVLEDDLLLLVMPVAVGVSLEECLTAGALTVPFAVATGIELFRALSEAHAAGVMHRDVKPANIVIAGSPPDLRLTLVDFGLARSGWLDCPLIDLPVGTARYVSPEQAGLLHHEVDERADLYSAGAVLFECLAGRPLFEGLRVAEVLRAHATARPPQLRGLGIDVPGALDEIIQHLLRKDPNDRYQTAAAALADLEQLADALAAGVANPPIVIGANDQRRTITEPSFVGRSKELAVLAAELERARSGDGALVLLEAESGGGKSRLLTEFAQRSGSGGAWVLKGQGLDQVAVQPFQLLSGVADEVVAATTGNADMVSALVERLGYHVEGAQAALPALDHLLPASGATTGPEEFGPLRVATSLVALLDALGKPNRPALVVLDDCQWADEPTLGVLERWAATPRPDAGRATMVVAAFRSEEVGPDHPLRRVDARRSLTLAPFGHEDVRGLIESMAGPLPNEVVQVVEQLAAGSPFMASAVLRGLVEMGALVRDSEAWEIDLAAVGDVQSSRRAAAFLTQRLRLLPESARRLLAVGAVLGKEFDLGLAAELAGQVASEAVAAVDEARRRHILWATARTGWCAFVHDKLREALLGDLDEKALADLHLRAAEQLEADPTPPIFELAYHFDAAGEPERALPYALAGGDEARRRHALDLAESQYRVAARGAGHDDGARLRAAIGLGEVLLLGGRYAEASEQLEFARLSTSDDATRAEIERSLGELAFKRGDVREAGAALERALRLMGRHPPRRTVMFGLLLAWEVVVQAAHTLLPGRLGRRDPTEGVADLAAARVYSRLAYTYWFGRGRVPTAWVHLRGMNIAERYPPGPELAQAWSEHAPVMTMIPWYHRAITYADRSLAIREELGDVWGQGQSLAFLGVALYASSQYADCIEKCRRAVRLLERTGDQWEVNTATWHIALSQYRLGQLDAAVGTAQRVHRSGTDLGDHQAAGIALGVWSKAAAGDVPEALVQAELGRAKDDVHASAEVLQAEALRLIRLDLPSEAVLVLQEADRLVRGAGLRQEYVSPVVVWLATAQRLQIEALGAWAPAQRRRDIRRARRTSRRARRTAHWYRNNMPHALREAGLLAALNGRPRRGRTLLNRSLTVATQQSARQEEAFTMLARGRVGVIEGWSGADRDTADGLALLASLRSVPDATENAPTLSLVDRFDRLLDEGRRVASALTSAEIFTAMSRAAEALLRPQGCRVVNLASSWDDALSSSRRPDDPIISRTLVEQALQARRPVSSGDDPIGDPGESMLLSSSRSAMAAPVYVRGRPVAVLYVTHDDVGDLYKNDDEQVAQFLTVIAGAALENAEGFAARIKGENDKTEAERVRLEAERMRVKAEWDKTDAERVRLEAERMRVEAEWDKTDAERVRLEAERTRVKAESDKAAEAERVRREAESVRLEAQAERERLESLLHQSQRLEGLGQLAGGVAHDFNNLLAVISNYASFVAAELTTTADTPANAQWAGPLRDVEQIQLAAQRGSLLVHQLLAFARREVVQPRVLDLNDSISGMEQILRRTIGEQLELVIDLAPGLPTVLADPGQIEQIILNLAINARDAMPMGGVISIGTALVEVGCDDAHAGPPPGRYVRCQVADTGVGMSPETRDRAFEPFFTTKPKGEGSGLGLATVYGIVSQSSGHTSIESEPGVGTTITVLLPATSQDGVQRDSEEGADGLEASIGTETILVVEDEEALLEVTRRILTRSGYTVVTAGSGAQATELAAMHDGRLDLVLTDVIMPKMQGPAVADEVSRLRPGIRVLFMSGYAQPVLVAGATPGKDVRLVEKPFTDKTLLATVREVLDARV